MKISVKEINGENCVVDSKFGTLNVVAKGHFEIGKSYFVEVDFDDVVDCSAVMLSEDNSESIKSDGDKYIVNAEFLTAGDGILTVSLDNGFASINATNTEQLPNSNHNKFIKFNVSRILIYNEEI